MNDPETQRLEREAERAANWKRWGPYLSERQWATVREDYSEQGDSWSYFPHDHARSRAYRWGEDGLLGLCDRQARLCFALALWNERDPFLKERLFGLTGPQGNHGEDVKEVYHYVDATPTYSYARAVYKYPQAAFPYEQLVAESARRGRDDPEYELADTGVFAEDRYWDVTVEYAKDGPDDILVKITIANRGPDTARLHVLPTLWCRNTWAWGRTGEGYWPRPELAQHGAQHVVVDHASLGRYHFVLDPSDEVYAPAGGTPHARGAPAGGTLLFTENETNAARLFRARNTSPYVKDAFHEYVVQGKRDAVNPARRGTRCAAHYVVTVAPGSEVTLRARLFADAAVPVSDPGALFGAAFERCVAQRAREADQFYAGRIPHALSPEEQRVARQAYAGLLWSKQFYNFVVREWLEGDPGQPAPPAARKRPGARNVEWSWLHCRDVLSMPDKWEYPWFAAWDLAFHMVPFARVDAEFAKQQLVLLLREWYMNPNGQLPAYEWNFGDVNPPVHAWAAWRVYKIAASRGQRDRLFLARVFQKLLLDFTWWVNRKDTEGNNLFSGGFLGLDNIGVFDRSKPLPTGGYLAQADGTAWMAFFCATMLEIALELAREDPAYEDVASKFFEHFVAITDAMNTLGGTGLWDPEDGFYYDQLVLDGGRRAVPLRVRSTVGVIPLFAAATIEQRVIDRLPGFARRMRWFMENRADLARHIALMTPHKDERHWHRLLAIPSRERLVSVLRYVLDEREFLSPYGMRSLSRVHREEPFVLEANGARYAVRYVPGESDSGLFGGNSNWRGPIWFPTNYLLIEALERYHHFYGDSLTVECPTGSGRYLTLREVARELAQRLTRIFLPDARGRRPCHGDDPRYASSPHFRDYVGFYEYFDGDTGRGCGARQQTGWTAMVVRLLEDLASGRGVHESRAAERGPGHGGEVRPAG